MNRAEEIKQAADVLDARDSREAALTADLLRSCAEEWAASPDMDDALVLARHINANKES